MEWKGKNGVYDKEFRRFSNMKNIDTMATIQEEKAKDIGHQETQPLDPEGVALAEHKRFTFDIIDTPVDPLR